jgi:hypothetical protein
MFRNQILLNLNALILFFYFMKLTNLDLKKTTFFNE